METHNTKQIYNLYHLQLTEFTTYIMVKKGQSYCEIAPRKIFSIC